MPLPLGIKKYHCIKCRYSKVINHKSDVIFVPRCPKCGCEMLMENRLGILDKLLGNLRKKLKW